MSWRSWSFYHEVFCLSHDRDAGLSAVEAFSLEVIDQLGRPTIGQFAEFLNISRSNATYKVAGLERLGYVRRERSGPDKREFYLVLTDEYYANAALLDEYVSALVERIRKRFTLQETAEFSRHALGHLNRAHAPEHRRQKGLTRADWGTSDLSNPVRQEHSSKSHSSWRKLKLSILRGLASINARPRFSAAAGGCGLFPTAH